MSSRGFVSKLGDPQITTQYIHVCNGLIDYNMKLIGLETDTCSYVYLIGLLVFFRLFAGLQQLNPELILTAGTRT